MSTSFFRIILPSVLEAKKLRIPGNFVRKFGYELGDVATLTVPNGSLWQVGLKKEGKNNIWFDDGWHEFAKYHSIGNGHFLLFKYGKDSKFQVLIFDKSACEIDYPCNGQNLVKRKERENDDSVEIVDLTTPKPHLKDRLLGECSKKRSCSKMCTSPSRQNLGESSSSKRTRKCVASLESSKFRQGYEMQSKKCNMEEQVEIREPPYGNPQRRGKLNKYEKDEFFVTLDDMGISISESFRRFTQKQRERALSAARFFKPANPSFIVMVTKTDIRRSYLSVPLKFARRYLGEVECVIVLDSGATEWPIKLSWNCARAQCLLSRWAGFRHDKNVVAGDICVFEMIKFTMKSAFLKLSIFHAQ